MVNYCSAIKIKVGKLVVRFGIQEILLRAVLSFLKKNVKIGTLDVRILKLIKIYQIHVVLK